MNLGMYLARSARFWPDRPAVLFRDGALSFRALEQRSNRIAHALKALGLKRGDRVAVVSPNRPEIVELECALYKAGLVTIRPSEPSSKRTARQSSRASPTSTRAPSSPRSALTEKPMKVAGITAQ